MFWADFQYQQRVFRSFLNGTGVTVLVSTGVPNIGA